jgi:hypothetical protein
MDNHNDNQGVGSRLQSKGTGPPRRSPSGVTRAAPSPPPSQLHPYGLPARPPPELDAGCRADGEDGGGWVLFHLPALPWSSCKWILAPSWGAWPVAHLAPGWPDPASLDPSSSMPLPLSSFLVNKSRAATQGLPVVTRMAAEEADPCLRWPDPACLPQFWVLGDPARNEDSGVHAALPGGDWRPGTLA